LNLEGASIGDEVADVGVLTEGVLVGGAPKGMATWWRGDAGRLRLDKEPVLLYRLDMPLLARGVSSSSASSAMSQTLGAPSKEPTDAGRIPEPYRSCRPDVARRGSTVRGLRGLGERRGEEGRSRGMGEGERVRRPTAGWRLAENCMTMGRECARVIGGASAL
jgi:hypothetical protein